jgi:hypothetical protein
MAVRLLNASDSAKLRHRRDIHAHPQVFHNNPKVVPQRCLGSIMLSTANVSPINRIRTSFSSAISAVDKNF